MLKIQNALSYGFFAPIDENEIMRSNTIEYCINHIYILRMRFQQKYKIDSSVVFFFFFSFLSSFSFSPSSRAYQHTIEMKIPEFPAAKYRSVICIGMV